MSYEEKDPIGYDSKDAIGLGQGAEVNVVPVTERESDDVKVDVHTQLYDGVQRKMKQRHMQMIALAGTLVSLAWSSPWLTGTNVSILQGTGLFLGSGKAIAHGGPAGALLAYITVGSIAYAMLCSLAEMTCFAPISG